MRRSQKCGAANTNSTGPPRWATFPARPNSSSSCSGATRDADVFRFDPVQARYVRIRATELATSWGGYTVYDLAVFKSLPEAGNSGN